MPEQADHASSETGHSYFHEKLVASLVALENFLAEIRCTAGLDEMLTLTLRHLQSLLPIDMAGFYLPDESGLDFSLHTTLHPKSVQKLNHWVDQAIDKGVFGWALKHLRPAAMKIPDGSATLILGALRTRQRVLGMFAALMSAPSASVWDAHAIILSTHLSCAADVIWSEELTVKLQEHNRTLDSIVQQRTQQLQQAKEAAEIATQAKSKFLATVSHELRTPLNAILGYSQILRGSDVIPPNHRFEINTIHQSAEHLLSLINDLLDLSKAEAASLEIVPAPVQLRELTREVENIIQPLAREKALGFACTIDPRLPATVMTDPRRLRQVLINLLGNAVKFTSQGAVQLNAFPAHDKVRFVVSDTGVGIAEQDLPKLFQPFQQLGINVQRAAGTGLGLAISKIILQAMNADLVVESELGKGTSFQFDLHLESHPSAQETDSASPVPDPPPVIQPSQMPNPDEIQILKDLAMNGDILELQKELERQLTKYNSSSPFLAQLLQWTLECKLRLIRNDLEKL